MKKFYIRNIDEESYAEAVKAWNKVKATVFEAGYTECLVGSPLSFENTKSLGLFAALTFPNEAAAVEFQADPEMKAAFKPFVLWHPTGSKNKLGVAVGFKAVKVA